LSGLLDRCAGCLDHGFAAVLDCCLRLCYKVLESLDFVFVPSRKKGGNGSRGGWIRQLCLALARLLNRDCVLDSVLVTI